MKRLLLILLCALLVWTQVPTATHCQAGESDLMACCACCADCGGACGCVAPGNGSPLPAPWSTLPAQSHNELLFAAAPLVAFALPSLDDSDSSFRSQPLAERVSIPLFRRDCALLL